jgi:lysophospholipid acyltransferase (LPLAT)-like uncharacterized protein
MTRLARNLFGGPALRGLVCAAAALYIRLVHATSRWRVEGAEAPRRRWAARQPFILAFWHGRLLLMPYCWDRATPISMLISRHRDGQLIARTVAHFGIAAVAGSSTKGGGRAMRAMLKALRAGECVGVTPDGPHGPRMRANAGLVNLAKLAGVPILPCSYSIRRGRLLGSWDRFLLALPFSRGEFRWGEPIHVAPDADMAALESARRQVEDSLNALTRAADLACGATPVEPAPESRAGPAPGAEPDIGERNLAEQDGAAAAARRA